MPHLGRSIRVSIDVDAIAARRFSKGSRRIREPLENRPRSVVTLTGAREC